MLVESLSPSHSHLLRRYGYAGPQDIESQAMMTGFDGINAEPNDDDLSVAKERLAEYHKKRMKKEKKEKKRKRKIQSSERIPITIIIPNFGDNR